MTPRTALETITPATAREYLAHNVKNRRPKHNRIGQYARDMAAGRWQITGESLKFDRTGNLIDGQNRLYAVIEAGVPVQTYVTRGLAPESQDVMDTGAVRSGADQLTIHGKPSGKNLQAALNAHYGYKSGAITRANADLTGATRLTNAEVIEYAEQHPGLGDAVRDASRYRRGLGLPIGALAVAVYEFGHIDADAAEEFFSRIDAMEFTGPGDDALRVLKRRVDGDRMAGKGRYRLGTALFMLFRTWNAWRTGERIVKLQTGSAERGWAAIPTLR